MSAELQAEGRADVWVRFAERPDMSQFAAISDWNERGQAVVDALQAAAESSQGGLRASLDKQDVDYQAFWATNSVRVSGADADLVTSMSLAAGVEGIYPTMQIEIPEIVPTVPEKAPNAVEWGVDDVNAPEVWADGVEGQDIVVASIDTGAQWDHPALIQQYRGNLGDGEVDHNYSWFDASGTSPDEPADFNGHGTHVTGTMVGDDGGDNQIGVAPGAKWIAANGCCPSDEALMSSGQWMLAPTDLNGENPDVSKRPHIINNSWGTTIPSNDPFMADVIEAWAAAGQFGVFANGNNGPGCNTSGAPGSLALSYSVGNYTSSHVIAPGSSRGPGENGEIKPDISAPGTAVRSSVPGNAYASYNGTSMASPHVAGAVALAWSASPILLGDVEGTRNLLDGTAIDTADDQCGGTPENNNVFGEGRLDAAALVDEAPIDDAGTLTGAVTAADDDSAIASASVQVVGPMERTLTTNSEGVFNTMLVAGEYDVTVSAFGYETHTQTVTIEAEETTTVNVALETAAAATIDGVITDGSGYGFPLYARIAVDGTPEATYSDPETGAYSLNIPSGSTYTVSVQVQYPGYTTPSREVTVSGDATENFAVEVDAVTCNAPGYHVTTEGLWETFDEETAPEGWDVVDHQGNDQVWRFDDPGDRGNQTGGEGGFAVVNSDDYGSGQTQNTTLVTPSVDMSGDETPAVGFKSDYYRFTNDSATVRVSLDGGETWEDVEEWTESRRGPREELVPLPMAAGESDVRIGFNYEGTWGWWWQIDDVFVGERSCVPAGEGGYVVGNVHDTADQGIVGATVTNLDDEDQTAVTTATPADENLADGFYWIFSDTPGENTLQASATNYETTTEEVTVVDGDVVRADFSLGSGLVVVEPGEIESTQDQDEVVEHSLTFTNDGTSAVEVELLERDGGFTAPAGAGVDVEPTTLDVPTSFAAFADDEAEVGTSAEGDFAPSDTWESLPDYPRITMDNRVVNVDGDHYVLGGTTGTAAFADVNRLDAETQTWQAVAPMPQAASAVNAEAVAGEIVVSGGWVASATTTDTYVYDAGADSWTQAASAPTGVSASGTAVIDGIMYVIGGCSTNECTPMSNNAMAYDVASDTWETLANYPTAAAFPTCGAVDGELVCSGGNPGSGGIASTYVYDAGADAWESLADAPTPHWAAGSTTANSQLVVQGGVQGPGAGAVSNATYAFDGDQWTTLAPASTPVYRGDISCGIVKVGGSTGAFNPVAAAEHLPGWDDCVTTSDVEWLELDPQTFTVEAGDSVEVTVATDSTGLDVGTYSGAIRVRSNTPESVEDIPVTMTVTGELPGAPAIEVDPESIDSTQEEGAASEHELTISNTGTADLSWTIAEAEAEADATAEADAQVSLPQGSDRASGAEVQGQAPQQVLPTTDPAATSTLTEGFDNVEGLPAAGWAMVNNSEPTGVLNWFQGNPDVFDSHQGAADAYVGSNYNAAGTSPGNINNWLMTPELELTDGAEFTFWTRGTGGEWPDRLEVRMSTNGASTDAGTGFDGVGDFTERLLVINENLGSDYPAEWTEYTVEIEGVEESTTGRLAFRYHVPNGGPNGINSDYIGVDTVTYEAADDTPPVPPSQCETPTDIAWMSVDPASGTTAAGETSTVTVTLNAAGLEPGDYEAQLCVSSDDTDNPLVQVPVSMTVTEETVPPVGVIEVDPTSVEHSVEFGGSDSTDVTFSNTGEADAEVSLSEDADWLSVDPEEFTVEADDSVDVAFTTDAEGLDAGTYTTQVEVTTDTGQELDAISVTLVVADEPVPPVGVIEVDPTSVEHSVEFGGSDSTDVSFSNTGEADAEVSLSEDVDWLSVDPEEFTVEADDSVDVAFTTDAEGLDAGTYTTQVEVATDTGQELEAISVTLVVAEEAEAPFEVERWSGTNRYGTAAAVSGTYAAGAEVVFLATGGDYPDALTGSALAGSLEAPVLLTRPGALPNSTKAELVRLAPERVVVLGGDGAVADAVLAEAAALTGAPVERVSGTNRYGTAAAVAAQFAGQDVERVFVATGVDYPDALSAAARAGALDSPVLLVRRTEIPSATAAALDALAPGSITVLGGEGAVDQDVVNELREWAPTTRTGGLNRWVTSARLFAEVASADTVYVASGQNWPDALAGGAKAGADHEPLLITRQGGLPGAIETALERLWPQKVVVLGGTTAVSDKVIEELEELLARE